ncbi:MAG: peptidoglycan DD-metalloendopeptidase family protein [Gammaproteobacteria bacterium]|nr:peptidoglycan DD-metalloendopeptidase family protein [Gammaproteobacteria bacterium]
MVDKPYSVSRRQPVATGGLHSGPNQQTDYAAECGEQNWMISGEFDELFHKLVACGPRAQEVSAKRAARQSASHGVSCDNAGYIQQTLPTVILPAPAPTASRTRLSYPVTASLVLLCAQTQPAYAQADSHPATSIQAIAQSRQREELVGLKQEINAEQRRLAQALHERQRLADQVQQAERDGSVVLRRLRQLERLRRARNKELDDLRTTLARKARAAKGLTAKLGFQIRADYIIDRQDYLKFILNQEDPSRLSRAIAYHRYVVRARARRLQALAAELEDMRALERSIAQRKDRLTQLHQQSAIAHKEFELQRGKRNQILAELNSRISDSGQRLKALRQDAAQLERVLTQLAAARRKLPDASELAAGAVEPEPFATLRGRLPWPTAGTLTHAFDHQREVSGAHWRGVRVSARAGTMIHAIAAGRVAYADWLRGFGLLLIVEHGDGYMSLYGHLLEVLAEPGEWVQAGARLGTVGDSGGQRESGLYFEIRRGGQPEDPVAWCKGRPSKPA